MPLSTYNISSHAIEPKHRPLTPNTDETAAFLSMHVSLMLTPNILYISVHQKSYMKMKSMLKIKNFHNRSQANGMDDLQYILRCISSQTSTSNSKYKRNGSFFYHHICLYTSHTVPHISQSIKSHE